MLLRGVPYLTAGSDSDDSGGFAMWRVGDAAAGGGAGWGAGGAAPPPTDRDTSPRSAATSLLRDAYLPGPGVDMFSNGGFPGGSLPHDAFCPDWDDIERIPWLDLLGGAIRSADAGQVSARNSRQRHVIHHVSDPGLIL